MLFPMVVMIPRSKEESPYYRCDSWLDGDTEQSVRLIQNISHVSSQYVNFKCELQQNS